MRPGRFVTFEGVDGAGKSTHLSWLSSFLRSRECQVTVTREPGGTTLGETLREVLLHQTGAMHPETEALLMFAARRDHIEQVIAPALARGEVVLCDRFTDATFAYQGAGRGVDRAKLEALQRWVHPDLQPDLTLVFDLPIELARERLARLKKPDRFEREEPEFYQRVRAEYLARAEQAPSRIRVINASRPIADIQREIGKIVADTCSI